MHEHAAPPHGSCCFFLLPPRAVAGARELGSDRHWANCSRPANVRLVQYLLAILSQAPTTQPKVHPSHPFPPTRVRAWLSMNQEKRAGLNNCLRLPTSGYTYWYASSRPTGSLGISVHKTNNHTRLFRTLVCRQPYHTLESLPLFHKRTLTPRVKIKLVKLLYYFGPVRLPLSPANVAEPRNHPCPKNKERLPPTNAYPIPRFPPTAVFSKSNPKCIVCYSILKATILFRWFYRT